MLYLSLIRCIGWLVFVVFWPASFSVQLPSPFSSYSVCSSWASAILQFESKFSFLSFKSSLVSYLGCHLSFCSFFFFSKDLPGRAFRSFWTTSACFIQKIVWTDCLKKEITWPSLDERKQLEAICINAVSGWTLQFEFQILKQCFSFPPTKHFQAFQLRKRVQNWRSKNVQADLLLIWLKFWW